MYAKGEIYVKVRVYLKKFQIIIQIRNFWHPGFPEGLSRSFNQALQKFNFIVIKGKLQYHIPTFFRTLKGLTIIIFVEA